jgi:predicted ATPase
VRANGGEVRFFEKPFAANQREIKQRIGYSTGAVNYYPKRKIEEIVAVTKTFYPNWDEAEYQKYLQLFELAMRKTRSWAQTWFTLGMCYCCLACSTLCLPCSRRLRIARPKSFDEEIRI